MNDIIENRKKIEQDRALKDKSLDICTQIVKVIILALRRTKKQLYATFPAPSLVIGEVHSSSEDQKIKFYKMHHNRTTI